MAKQMSRWFGILLFFTGGIIGAVVAAMLASYLASSAIVNNWVNNQTSYAQSHVLALRQLREDNSAEALSILEDQLNKDIVSLLPNRMEEFHISEQTQARVDQTLDAAKRYRKDYPREYGGTLLEQEVEQALSGEK